MELNILGDGRSAHVGIFAGDEMWVGNSLWGPKDHGLQKQIGSPSIK